MRYLIIGRLFLTGCASEPKPNKYESCTYPSVDCIRGGLCHLRDPRLKEVNDFCMPTKISKALDLWGYR